MVSKDVGKIAGRTFLRKVLYPRQDSHKRRSQEEHIWEILPPLKEGRGGTEVFFGGKKPRGRAEIVYPQRGGGQAKEIKDRNFGEKVA